MRFPDCARDTLCSGAVCGRREQCVIANLPQTLTRATPEAGQRLGQTVAPIRRTICKNPLALASISSVNRTVPQKTAEPNRCKANTCIRGKKIVSHKCRVMRNSVLKNHCFARKTSKGLEFINQIKKTSKRQNACITATNSSPHFTVSVTQALKFFKSGLSEIRGRTANT